MGRVQCGARYCGIIYRNMTLDLSRAQRKLGPNRAGWLASDVKAPSEDHPEPKA